MALSRNQKIAAAITASATMFVALYIRYRVRAGKTQPTKKELADLLEMGKKIGAKLYYRNTSEPTRVMLVDREARRAAADE